MTKPIDYKKELENGNECGPGCTCGSASEPSVASDPSASEPTGAQPCCGPSCDCGTPSRTSWGKVVMVLLVLAAAIAIVVAKLAGGDKATEATAPSPVAEAKAPSLAVAEGDVLKSFLDVNTVAANPDAAFVVVPTVGSNGVSEAFLQPIFASRQKLEAQGMTVGVYVLRSDSPDVAAMANRYTLPGVLVLSRSAGKPLVAGDKFDAGMLTGRITEANLLQAYVASSLGAAGGGCNCGAASECGSK